MAVQLEESAAGGLKWKDRQKQQLRDALLSSAVELSEENGFEALSVDEIVNKTGVAKGTFYLYFKSKSELLSEIFEAGISELERRTAEAISTNGIDSDVLGAVIKTQAGFFNERPAMADVIMGRSQSIPIDISDEISSRSISTTVQVYERLIRLGTLQQKYRDLDASIAAYALRGLMEGMLLKAPKTDNNGWDLPMMVKELFEKGISRK